MENQIEDLNDMLVFPKPPEEHITHVKQMLTLP